MQEMRHQGSSASLWIAFAVACGACSSKSDTAIEPDKSSSTETRPTANTTFECSKSVADTSDPGRECSMKMTSWTCETLGCYRTEEAFCFLSKFVGKTIGVGTLCAPTLDECNRWREVRNRGPQEMAIGECARTLPGDSVEPFPD